MNKRQRKKRFKKIKKEYEFVTIKLEPGKESEALSRANRNLLLYGVAAIEIDGKSYE